ncbi:SDR family NAD(P)-dependent oxidoreductase [Hwanghaeella sp.]|uniref:SDR family NAD(P)-dependent oxidoreductase n=1 Tax=Hwanghaeella sp. TaxID=2605943 RepID=UPI003CCC0FDA
MFGIGSSVAVVTGAGQGNGAAIARGLAKAGAAVALADINGEAVAAVAEEIGSTGGKAFARRLDVTDPSAAQDFAAATEQALGPAKLLVNNAGVIHRTPIDEADHPDAWAKTFAVNVDGTRFMARAYLDQLIGTKGSVVNLGSIMSFTTGPGLTAYAASKGAVAQFTKALASELAPKGVRVNALLPGVIATPMTQATRDNPEAIAKFLAHTPMGRVGEPEELVGPILFLASDAASYVTGALLPVDGGYLTV